MGIKIVFFSRLLATVVPFRGPQLFILPEYATRCGEHISLLIFYFLEKEMVEKRLHNQVLF